MVKYCERTEERMNNEDLVGVAEARLDGIRIVKASVVVDSALSSNVVTSFWKARFVERIAAEVKAYLKDFLVVRTRDINEYANKRELSAALLVVDPDIFRLRRDEVLSEIYEKGFLDGYNEHRQRCDRPKTD